MKYFLTVAASDNSGGAGIQQDIKTADRLGYWGLSAITGITVQNFKKLNSISPVPANILSRQIEMNIDSFNINAFKIGALCSDENIHTIATILKKHKLKNVVLDTVFAPTCGKPFITKNSVALFRKELLPYVRIITPNKDELSLLTEQKITTVKQGIDASVPLTKQYGCCVYLKGGHFTGDTINETLVTKDNVISFEKGRLSLTYSHGTGCTFSTALSCYIGDGYSLKDACAKASGYVNEMYRKYC